MPTGSKPRSRRTQNFDFPYLSRAVRNRDGVLWTDNGQNLAADFTPSGVRVDRGNTLWGMRMVAYGYGNDLRAVDPAPLQATGNRVEYRHGSLTEWYVNGPRGLEQGFTIAQPPGQRHGRPLTVALALSGDFNARKALRRMRQRPSLAIAFWRQAELFPL